MSKHTPGPWKQGKTNQCNVSANNALVCRTFPRGQYNTDSAEANARLIASAPDLLEALHAVLSASGDDETLAAYKAARAAIAKATNG